MNPLPIVLAEIRTARSGVIAIIVLIALAVALGVAVSAQERALRQGSASAADRFDLLIGAPGSKAQLVFTTVYLQPFALPLIPGELLTKLQGDPGVAYVAPIGFGDFHLGFPVVGATVDFASNAGRIRPAEGRLFESLWEVVVGADVPLAVGDQFAPSHGRPDPLASAPHVHEHVRHVVVGRLPRTGSPWDRAIIGPVEAVWAIHGLGAEEPREEARKEAEDGHHGEHAQETEHAHDARIGPPWHEGSLPGVPVIVVKPKSVADAYRLRGAYGRGQTMALFPAEVLTELYARLGDARDVLALISLGTQALVIGAVLLAVFAALAQRRRRMAVLRALGASRSYLFATVWLHVMILVAAGALAGLALGYAGAVALSWVLWQRTGVQLPVTLTAQEFVLVGSIMLVGMALALLPALSAYRQSISRQLQVEI